MYSVFENESITERKLTMNHGTEGAKHDLYSYEEYNVWKNGILITLHMGLVTWIRIDEILKLYDKEAINLFKQITGLYPGTFEKAYNKLQYFIKCPGCGSKERKTEMGFPGETLEICAKCRKIISCDFNELEII